MSIPGKTGNFGLLIRDFFHSGLAIPGKELYISIENELLTEKRIV